MVGLASLILVIISTIAAGASAIIAWTARADSLRSEDKADEAQKAAQSAAERATIATERMSMMQASVFNSPPWSIEWFNGDTYLLTNTSSVDAVDVTLQCSFDDDGTRYGMDEMPGTIGARSAVKMMASRTFATPWVTDIIVTWRRPGEEELRTWRHPIPWRPKK